MVVLNGNTLSLSSNYDSTSVVRMITLNEECVQLEFGNKVLEIPNESRTAGAVVGLYGWNGERINVLSLNLKPRIKMKPGSEWPIVVIIFVQMHRIIQDICFKEAQYWEIIDVEDITLSKVPGKKSFPQKIELIDNRVIFCTSVVAEKTVLMRITDLHGRIVRSEIVKTNREYILRTEKFARGLYMITSQLSGQKLSRRFVVK